MNMAANIMVVESDGIVSRDILNILEKMGHDVLITAASGEEAVQESEKYRIDLLLVDILLDGEMDGIEAAGQIYSRFKVPIVFLSSTLDKKTIKRAEKMRPYGIIVKPFEERILQATIETALYRYNMEKRETEKTESKPDVKKGKKLIENPVAEQEGEWIRSTFIIRKEHVENIKAVAYWERKRMKDILDEALEHYFINNKLEYVKKKGK